MRVFYIIWLFFVCQLSYAQDLTHSLSGGIMPGFLLAHTPDLKNIESHIISVELNYEVDKSDKDWAAYYRRPIAGFGLNYMNFRNEKTGHAFTAQANLKFSLIQVESVKIQFRLGTGIAYLSKSFEPNTNRRNQAIGSHFNAFMQSAFLFNRNISGGSVDFGFGVSHFSNGAFKMPNLGYNLPMLYFRYNHLLHSEPYELIEKQKFNKDINYNVSMIYAQKERNMARPQTFNDFGLQARVRWNTSPVKAWRIGPDLMLDKTYKYDEDILADLNDVPIFDQFEMGLAGGFEWRAGDLRALGEMGVYLYMPNSLKELFYQRMGFCYNLNNTLSLQTTLKFQQGTADCFEWGISYNIKS